MNDMQLKTFALEIASRRNTCPDVLKEAQRIYNWLSPQLTAQKASDKQFYGQAQAGGAILGSGSIRPEYYTNLADHTDGSKLG